MAGSADTIAAIASPPGAGARAIVRASGARCAELVQRCTGLAPGALRAREVRAIEFDDGVGAQPGWLWWMRGPRSLTGEDMAEFQLPGNPALAQAALARLLALGARAAGPGEFTRRAFLAGKLDLTRAEGILVLVQAQDEDEQRSGSRLLSGGLARRVDRAREALADVRALCEASLDFDESETGHVPRAELEALLVDARRELALALAEESDRPAESGLAQVVLSGAPNAGKSQLFNALSGAAGALVSPEPGTTRDSLRARLELAGLALELWDTAGLAAGQGPVERTAQAHARRERSSAELVLWVVDAAAPLEPAEALLAELDPRARVLLAWNKLDLEGARPRPPEEWLADARLGGAWVGVSGRTGAGLPELRRQLALLAAGRPGLSRELAARHVQALRRSGQALEQGASALAASAALELVAEHFREASGALDEILGTTTPEQVLERIFQRFCIGK